MDEALVDRLARKVNGRFKLATLIMKRLIEINRGSQPMVEPETENLLTAVLREADLDLIRLIPRLPAPEETPEQGEPVIQDE
jgi:DNA-directed RNA polymerase subunit omega